MIEPDITSRRLGDAELTVAVWGGGPPGIVLLHDGLGSIDQWRSVPALIAGRTGQTVMAYDRPGHGSSTPAPAGPWPVDWMHQEAERLAGLLRALEIEQPVLAGHSDGGTIALLHAVSAGEGVAGVIALASHSWVEQVCVDSISHMRANRPSIVAGLARYHEASAALFDAWSGAWTSDAFRCWDIRPQLDQVVAPALIAQGERDEYATDAQAIETALAIGDNAQCLLVADAGHLFHHDDPDAVVSLILDFCASRAGG